MPDENWLVNELEYLEAPQVSVLAFHNVYPQGRQGGVEIVHHGERVASCGQIRPNPAAGRPRQYTTLREREVDPEAGTIAARVFEPALGLNYTVSLVPDGEALRLLVELDAPLDPDARADAAFCLELYPPAFFGKTFQLDGVRGVFPLSPTCPTSPGADGRALAGSIARGRRLTLAAEDPLRRMVVEGVGCDVRLMDSRKGDEEQWFTVFTPVPLGAAGPALEWRLTPSRVPGWRRDPVICVSQVGYHPDQAKHAVIEQYPGWEDPGEVALLRVSTDGPPEAVVSARAQHWGRFLRYDYGVFDFTDVREPGLYFVRCAGQTAGPFRIAPDVYRDGAWQPTMETFIPVQMCHAAVWDGLRLWHGACHLDDAVQAPTSHNHFDGYSQGPTTDSPYEPFDHIPHLDRGGWHDAGDTDLAAGSQAMTTHYLALAREEFGLDADQTTVREAERLVLLYKPDGVPDVLQQVAWGAQCLLGGYRAAGHSFSGIINGDARRYYQRGEVSTMTDNLVYDPSLAEHEVVDGRSGRRDDRWAFTSRDTSVEYRVAAALAAASRVLQGHDDPLAEECLATAAAAWEYEQTHAPASHRSAYNPGRTAAQEVLAAAELLLATGESRYRDRLIALEPAVKEGIPRVAATVARVLPHLDDDAFAAGFDEALAAYAAELAEELSGNPFGVPWRPRIWGEAWRILGFAVDQYYLTRSRPDLFDRERVLAAVNYVLGCHPGNNRSLVSGVGTASVTVAFGINRASWGHTPGGVISGPNLIRPDLPELKDDFPFLWQQSEYVIFGAASYVFCVLAADALLNGDDPGRQD